MKICHEHSRLTLNSTSDYRRFVVGAMCLKCYPKMQKTSRRGTITCWIVLTIAIIIICSIIISNKVVNKATQDHPKVYDTDSPVVFSHPSDQKS